MNELDAWTRSDGEVESSAGGARGTGDREKPRTHVANLVRTHLENLHLNPPKFDAVIRHIEGRNGDANIRGIIRTAFRAINPNLDADVIELLHMVIDDAPEIARQLEESRFRDLVFDEANDSEFYNNLKNSDKGAIVDAYYASRTTSWGDLIFNAAVTRVKYVLLDPQSLREVALVSNLNFDSLPTKKVYLEDMRKIFEQPSLSPGNKESLARRVQGYVRRLRADAQKRQAEERAREAEERKREANERERAAKARVPDAQVLDNKWFENNKRNFDPRTAKGVLTSPKVRLPATLPSSVVQRLSAIIDVAIRDLTENYEFQFQISMDEFMQTEQTMTAVVKKRTALFSQLRVEYEKQLMRALKYIVASDMWLNRVFPESKDTEWRVALAEGRTLDPRDVEDSELNELIRVCVENTDGFIPKDDKKPNTPKSRKPEDVVVPVNNKQSRADTHDRSGMRPPMQTGVPARSHSTERNRSAPATHGSPTMTKKGNEGVRVVRRVLPVAPDKEKDVIPPSRKTESEVAHLARSSTIHASSKEEEETENEVGDEKKEVASPKRSPTGRASTEDEEVDVIPHWATENEVEEEKKEVASPKRSPTGRASAEDEEVDVIPHWATENEVEEEKKEVAPPKRSPTGRASAGEEKDVIHHTPAPEKKEGVSPARSSSGRAAAEEAEVDVIPHRESETKVEEEKKEVVSPARSSSGRTEEGEKDVVPHTSELPAAPEKKEGVSPARSSTSRAAAAAAAEEDEDGEEEDEDGEEEKDVQPHTSDLPAAPEKKEGVSPARLSTIRAAAAAAEDEEEEEEEEEENDVVPPARKPERRHRSTSTPTESSLSTNSFKRARADVRDTSWGQDTDDSNSDEEAGASPLAPSEYTPYFPDAWLRALQTAEATTSEDVFVQETDANSAPDGPWRMPQKTMDLDRYVTLHSREHDDATTTKGGRSSGDDGTTPPLLPLTPQYAMQKTNNSLVSEFATAVSGFMLEAPPAYFRAVGDALIDATHAPDRWTLRHSVMLGWFMSRLLMLREVVRFLREYIQRPAHEIAKAAATVVAQTNTNERPTQSPAYKAARARALRHMLEKSCAATLENAQFMWAVPFLNVQALIARGAAAGATASSVIPSELTDATMTKWQNRYAVMHAYLSQDSCTLHNRPIASQRAHRRASAFRTLRLKFEPEVSLEELQAHANTVHARVRPKRVRKSTSVLDKFWRMLFADFMPTPMPVNMKLFNTRRLDLKNDGEEETWLRRYPLQSNLVKNDLKIYNERDPTDIALASRRRFRKETNAKGATVQAVCKREDEAAHAGKTLREAAAAIARAKGLKPRALPRRPPGTTSQKRGRRTPQLGSVNPAHSFELLNQIELAEENGSVVYHGGAKISTTATAARRDEEPSTGRHFKLNSDFDNMGVRELRSMMLVLVTCFPWMSALEYEARNMEAFPHAVAKEDFVLYRFYRSGTLSGDVIDPAFWLPSVFVFTLVVPRKMKNSRFRRRKLYLRYNVRDVPLFFARLGATHAGYMREFTRASVDQTYLIVSPEDQGLVVSTAAQTAQLTNALVADDADGKDEEHVDAEMSEEVQRRLAEVNAFQPPDWKRVLPSLEDREPEVRREPALPREPEREPAEKRDNPTEQPVDENALRAFCHTHHLSASAFSEKRRESLEAQETENGERIGGEEISLSQIYSAVMYESAVRARAGLKEAELTKETVRNIFNLELFLMDEDRAPNALEDSNWFTERSQLLAHKSLSEADRDLMLTCLDHPGGEEETPSEAFDNTVRETGAAILAQVQDEAFFNARVAQNLGGQNRTFPWDELSQYNWVPSLFAYLLPNMCVELVWPNEMIKILFWKRSRPKKMPMSKITISHNETKQANFLLRLYPHEPGLFVQPHGEAALSVQDEDEDDPFASEVIDVEKEKERVDDDVPVAEREATAREETKAEEETEDALTDVTRVAVASKETQMKEDEEDEEEEVDRAPHALAQATHVVRPREETMVETELAVKVASPEDPPDLVATEPPVVLLPMGPPEHATLAQADVVEARARAPLARAFDLLSAPSSELAQLVTTVQKGLKSKRANSRTGKTVVPNKLQGQENEQDETEEGEEEEEEDAEEPTAFGGSTGKRRHDDNGNPSPKRPRTTKKPTTEGMPEGKATSPKQNKTRVAYEQRFTQVQELAQFYAFYLLHASKTQTFAFTELQDIIKILKRPRAVTKLQYNAADYAVLRKVHELSQHIRNTDGEIERIRTLLEEQKLNVEKDGINAQPLPTSYYLVRDSANHTYTVRKGLLVQPPDGNVSKLHLRPTHIVDAETNEMWVPDETNFTLPPGIVLATEDAQTDREFDDRLFGDNMDIHRQAHDTKALNVYANLWTLLDPSRAYGPLALIRKWQAFQDEWALGVKTPNAPPPDVNSRDFLPLFLGVSQRTFKRFMDDAVLRKNDVAFRELLVRLLILHGLKQRNERKHIICVSPSAPLMGWDELTQDEKYTVTRAFDSLNPGSDTPPDRADEQRVEALTVLKPRAIELQLQAFNRLVFLGSPPNHVETNMHGGAPSAKARREQKHQENEQRKQETKVRSNKKKKEKHEEDRRARMEQAHHEAEVFARASVRSAWDWTIRFPNMAFLEQGVLHVNTTCVESIRDATTADDNTTPSVYLPPVLACVLPSTEQWTLQQSLRTKPTQKRLAVIALPQELWAAPPPAPQVPEEPQSGIQTKVKEWRQHFQSWEKQAATTPMASKATSTKKPKPNAPTRGGVGARTIRKTPGNAANAPPRPAPFGQSVDVPMEPIFSFVEIFACLFGFLTCFPAQAMLSILDDSDVDAQVRLLKRLLMIHGVLCCLNESDTNVRNYTLNTTDRIHINRYTIEEGVNVQSGTEAHLAAYTYTVRVRATELCDIMDTCDDSDRTRSIPTIIKQFIASDRPETEKRPLPPDIREGIKARIERNYFHQLRFEPFMSVFAHALSKHTTIDPKRPDHLLRNGQVNWIEQYVLPLLPWLSISTKNEMDVSKYRTIQYIVGPGEPTLDTEWKHLMSPARRLNIHFDLTKGTIVRSNPKQWAWIPQKPKSANYYPTWLQRNSILVIHLRLKQDTQAASVRDRIKAQPWNKDLTNKNAYVHIFKQLWDTEESTQVIEWERLFRGAYARLHATEENKLKDAILLRSMCNALGSMITRRTFLLMSAIDDDYTVACNTLSCAHSLLPGFSASAAQFVLVALLTYPADLLRAIVPSFVFTKIADTLSHHHFDLSVATCSMLKPLQSERASKDDAAKWFAKRALFARVMDGTKRAFLPAIEDLDSLSPLLLAVRGDHRTSFPVLEVGENGNEERDQLRVKRVDVHVAYSPTTAPHVTLEDAQWDAVGNHLIRELFAPQQTLLLIHGLTSVVSVLRVQERLMELNVLDAKTVITAKRKNQLRFANDLMHRVVVRFHMILTILGRLDRTKTKDNLCVAMLTKETGSVGDDIKFVRAQLKRLKTTEDNGINVYFSQPAIARTRIHTGPIDVDRTLIDWKRTTDDVGKCFDTALTMFAQTGHWYIMAEGLIPKFLAHWRGIKEFYIRTQKQSLVDAVRSGVRVTFEWKFIAISCTVITNSNSVALSTAAKNARETQDREMKATAKVQRDEEVALSINNVSLLQQALGTGIAGTDDEFSETASQHSRNTHPTLNDPTEPEEAAPPEEIVITEVDMKKRTILQLQWTEVRSSQTKQLLQPPVFASDNAFLDTIAVAKLRAAQNEDLLKHTEKDQTQIDQDKQVADEAAKREARAQSHIDEEQQRETTATAASVQAATMPPPQTQDDPGEKVHGGAVAVRRYRKRKRSAFSGATPSPPRTQRAWSGLLWPTRSTTLRRSTHLSSSAMI